MLLEYSFYNVRYIVTNALTRLGLLDNLLRPEYCIFAEIVR